MDAVNRNGGDRKSFERSQILANSHDTLAQKISANRKQKYTKEQTGNYFRHLYELAQQTYGIDKNFLLGLDHGEFIALEEELRKYAERKYKRFYYFWMPLLFLIPIIGWVAIIARYADSSEEFLPLKFIDDRHNLENECGKDFIQSPAIRNDFCTYLHSSL